MPLPFIMKNGHSRKPIFVKTYLAVFVCFSTKASPPTSRWSQTSPRGVLAGSCLGEAFQRRFTLTNGSNFRGANNNLIDLYLLLQSETTKSSINSYLLAQRVQWHCIPERVLHLAPSGKLQLNLPSAIFNALSAPRDWTSRSSQQWQLKSRPASIADPS